MSNLNWLLPIDNLDDRREIFYALSKMSVAERRAFLLWAAGVTNGRTRLRHNPPWVEVNVKFETDTVDEAYMDLMGMIANYDLDLPTVLAELERRAAGAKKLWLP